jgi:hypothetical protein
MTPAQSFNLAYKLRAVPIININYHYVEGELEYIYKDADLVALVTHQAFAPRVSPSDRHGRQTPSSILCGR